MNGNTRAIIPRDETTINDIIHVVLDELNSQNSKRSYQTALEDFLSGGQAKASRCSPKLWCSDTRPRNSPAVYPQRRIPPGRGDQHGYGL
jgi:hypothetical protein